MTTSKAVVWLSVLVALLALVAASAGLFWPGGGGPELVTSIRGEAVELFGRGLYRYDTRFVGSLNRGTDAAVLLVAIPLLLVAVGWYRRGSLRGALLLTATLAYFLYVYASAALGATAYNSFFLFYVALFSASLFALARLLTGIDTSLLAARLSPNASPRGLSVFMLTCGVVTAVVWLGLGLLPVMLRWEVPVHLDTYATAVTDALDLGLITPATFLAGYLLLRRNPLGSLLAFPLLGILVLLGPTFVAQNISQALAGITFTSAEVIGPIAGFGLLSLVAIWFLVSLLRHVSEPGAPFSAPTGITGDTARLPTSEAHVNSSCGAVVGLTVKPSQERSEP
jgi:hypothetical protein